MFGLENNPFKRSKNKEEKKSKTDLNPIDDSIEETLGYWNKVNKETRPEYLDKSLRDRSGDNLAA